jgi:L-Ala-D/L-Glu epimerase
VELQAQQLEMPLATPFRIARGTQQVAQNIFVQIMAGESIGYGEAAPRTFFGETPETALSVLRYFADHLGDDPFAIDTIMTRLERLLRFNASTRAAIDMALYDIVGKRLGVPVYQLLGLSPVHLPVTSYTIPIDAPAEMAHRAILARDYPILKIKLGSRHDMQTIREIRDVSNAILRVDVNAGWTVKQALQMIEQLAPYHIEMIEQPIPPGDLTGLKLIHDKSPIPIFADESCVTYEDIPQLAGVVDGINIKLMKCGGISHALKMIHVARAHGLKIMIGCMVESSLAITAAAHLAPLVDMLDLDGALLLRDDPFEGVQIVEGQLMLPDEPGLGVRPREGLRRLIQPDRKALPSTTQT